MESLVLRVPFQFARRPPPYPPFLQVDECSLAMQSVYYSMGLMPAQFHQFLSCFGSLMGFGVRGCWAQSLSRFTAPPLILTFSLCLRALCHSMTTIMGWFECLCNRVVV